jgi:hypothetical protein
MSANGNGGRCHYYACSGRQKYGPKACDGERLPREKTRNGGHRPARRALPRRASDQRGLRQGERRGRDTTARVRATARLDQRRDHPRRAGAGATCSLGSTGRKCLQSGFGALSHPFATLRRVCPASRAVSLFFGADWTSGPYRVLREPLGRRGNHAAARALKAPSAAARTVSACRGSVSSTGSPSGCTGTRARTLVLTSMPGMQARSRQSIWMAW